MRTATDPGEWAGILALPRSGQVDRGSFLCPGPDRKRVFGMAAALHAALAADGENGPVCVATNDRALLAAALLAGLAGGPPLLLPPGLSGRILEQMRKQTGFQTIITDRRDRLPPALAGMALQPDQEDRGVLPSGCRPEAELLRIFTGGSTGSPQVWSKTGLNIFAEALYLARHFGITDQDRIVATVPPWHIYGLLFSVVLPLVSGAGVVSGMPGFPADIGATIREQRATVLAAVPAHYRALRNHPLDSSTLRLAVSSAGMLDESDSLAFFRQNRVEVVEVYGSTETGGIATRNRAAGESCFRAFATVRWQIRSGLLAVSSPYLSPDLDLDEDGFFLTADRAEAAGQGFLLRGRADGVTKVGGKRVDLDQVRQVIRAHPGVIDCVVLALPEDSGRGHRIGALVQGGNIDPSALQAHLRQELEPHARPRILKTVDEMPLRENGKYDRQAILALLER